MNKKMIFVVIGIFFAAPIFAQEKVLTLEECINHAIEHNPQRQKQEAQNEIYRLDRLEAIGGFLPSLSAGSSVSMNFGRGIDPETNTYISTNTLGNSYDLSSSTMLFDGLATVYRAKMAKINRLRGDEQLQETKDKIALETMELFFNVLYFQGTVNLAKQQLLESETALRRIQRMEELGLKAIPDVAEIKAKEAEDRYMLTRQMNLLELEIIKLKTKMNFPIDEKLAVAEYKTEILIDRTDDRPEEIFQQALTSLPRLLAAGKILSATEMQQKMARGRLFPSLSFRAGSSTNFSRMMDMEYAPFKSQLKNRLGHYIGFSLSIPIFDRFSNTSELSRSKQRVVIAKKDNEELNRQVYSDIEQAVADVNGLADEYRFAQKRSESMQSAHQVNLRKYEEGLLSAIELNTSSNRLLNSRVEELYTSLKYQLKYKLLNYYKGNALY